jgi:MFS transporter, DHA2 family, multidrug resistance protein
MVYRRAVAAAPEAARGTLGGALAVADGLPANAGAALTRVAREAFVQAMELTAVIETVIVVVMAIMAIVMLRKTHPEP